MISFIRGIVLEKQKQSLTIETSGGVGYDIHLTAERLTEYPI